MNLGTKQKTEKIILLLIRDFKDIKQFLINGTINKYIITSWELVGIFFLMK